MSDSQISNIENPGSGRQPTQCVYEVFRIWREDSDRQDGGDYPYSWAGLLELLEDTDHGTLAGDLREVMLCELSSILGNLRSLRSTEVERKGWYDIFMVSYSLNVFHHKAKY